MLAVGILKLAHDCVMMVGPFILEQLLKNLQNDGSSKPWLSVLVLHKAQVSCGFLL